VIIEFNEAGRRFRELRYNHQDELVERNIYEEDEQGRVIRVIEENKARKNTTDYTYDEKGNVILQVETDLNGGLNHQVIRRYDDEGHIITATVEAVMKPSGLPRAYTLVYKRELY
jgi:YD repeat-containing protein